jgi:hypothetical protein
VGQRFNDIHFVFDLESTRRPSEGQGNTHNNVLDSVVYTEQRDFMLSPSSVARVWNRYKKVRNDGVDVGSSNHCTIFTG